MVIDICIVIVSCKIFFIYSLYVKTAEETKHYENYSGTCPKRKTCYIFKVIIGIKYNWIVYNVPKKHENLESKQH